MGIVHWVKERYLIKQRFSLQLQNWLAMLYFVELISLQSPQSRRWMQLSDACDHVHASISWKYLGFVAVFAAPMYNMSITITTIPNEMQFPLIIVLLYTLAHLEIMSFPWVLCAH